MKKNFGKIVLVYDKDLLGVGSGFLRPVVYCHRQSVASPLLTPGDRGDPEEKVVSWNINSVKSTKQYNKYQKYGVDFNPPSSNL